MKQISTFLIALTMIPLISFAANGIDDIINALKNADAKKITDFFDTKVDISMPGKTGSYTKSQAESMIKDFFNNNKVQSFEEKHRGENNGMQYCTGNLVTQNGVYKTTFLTKLKGDNQLIQTLRFELK